MGDCEVGEMCRNKEGSGRCHLILGQEESHVSELAITVFCPLDQNHGFGSRQQIGPARTGHDQIPLPSSAES